MERRKFVVGLGSLAAGASVTMSTGALSATEANRHMTGTVADDGSAYVRMYGTSQHGKHVDESGTEISLDFGDVGDGDGLNANATSWFDHVFFVEINSPEGSPSSLSDYEFWIELNVTQNSGDIDFYRGQDRNNSIVGKSNRVGFWSGGGDRGSVGVMFDLQGTGLSDGDDLENHFGVPSGQNLFTVHVDNKA